VLRLQPAHAPRGATGAAARRDIENTIIGDVWLYNRSVTTADWSAPPFPNPPEFARAFEGALPGPADLTVRWTHDDALLLADIEVRGELLARLSPGAQPGWNKLATCDGPLAQVMPNPEDD
jgi:hypothetical protein